MKTYLKYLIKIFLKSFAYVSLVMFGLIFIINLLSELDFFKEINISSTFALQLAFLNAPSLIFEIFPFIFLISTQFFFINLFNNNEIQIFKYSGLKNTRILSIIIITTFALGFFIVLFFYNFSSSLKNIYLELKSSYTSDGKYLAVITKNGLWIKDKVDNKNLIVNSNKLEKNLLVDAFIVELNEEFESIRAIKSNKIDILNKEWIIYNAEIFENNNKINKETIFIKTNFDYNRIQSLFSNLSALSFKELFELKENYKSLNYSTTEVDIQIQKLISFPIYITLMTILSAVIMFNTKNFQSYTLKVAIGFFLSVIVYYFNNFFNALGITEKISYNSSIWVPLILLSIINLFVMRNINEK